MLNICNEKHEEIVYEGKRCPLCTAIGKIEDLELYLENTNVEKELEIKNND